jgi:hypothetical protein
MATCVVTGTLKDTSETAISGATVKVNIVTPTFNGGTALIMPKELSTTSNASGVFTVTLARGLSVLVSIDYPPNATDSTRRQVYAVTIPDAATATFSTLVTEL